MSREAEGSSPPDPSSSRELCVGAGGQWEKPEGQGCKREVGQALPMLWRVLCFGRNERRKQPSSRREEMEKASLPSYFT